MVVFTIVRPRNMSNINRIEDSIDSTCRKTPVETSEMALNIRGVGGLLRQGVFTFK
jgi:hypothetical protein